MVTCCDVGAVWALVFKLACGDSADFCPDGWVCDHIVDVLAEKTVRDKCLPLLRSLFLQKSDDGVVVASAFIVEAQDEAVVGGRVGGT